MQPRWLVQPRVEKSKLEPEVSEKVEEVDQEQSDLVDRVSDQERELHQLTCPPE